MSAGEGGFLSAPFSNLDFSEPISKKNVFFE